MIIHIDRRLGILSGLILLLLSALSWYIYYKLDQAFFPPPAQPDIKQTLYGEYLPWEQVSLIFPKYAQCTVQDFETGKQFQVVRRAGSSHADVQPLTARDTEIMKSIYGQWSWKRRAVLVKLIDGRMIAGSMNGMPHGAGAVKGNNFKGHFCIHFRGSKTHSSSRLDPVHQAMIWKSAGMLEEELSSMPAPQVLETFFAVLDEGDEKLLSALLIDGGDQYDPGGLTDIEYSELRKLVPQNETTYTVTLRLRRAGEKKEQTILLSPVLSQQPYWRIHTESLDALFKKASLQTLARADLPASKLQFCAAQFSANPRFPNRLA